MVQILSFKTWLPLEKGNNCENGRVASPESEHILRKFSPTKEIMSQHTVELQWLEHLWDHEN